jgi:hypothetical protein
MGIDRNKIRSVLMKRRRGCSIDLMVSARLHLEILEARYLLSTFQGAAGVRLHRPAAGAAERSSEGVGGLSADGSGSGAAVAPGVGSATAARGQGQGEGDSPAVALPASLATGESATTAQVDNRAAEGSDNTVPVSPAAAGSAVAANLVASPAPVRAVPATDASSLDESPSTSQSSGAAASSPFGQGSTGADEETFALPVAVDRPRAATDNAQAPELGATVPVGPAMAMGARSPVVDPGAARVTLTISSDGPAIPAGSAKASDPSSSHGERIAAWPPKLTSTKGGRPRGEELPSSVGADLLASFSPFDRATVERAFDQLLDRFDDLEAGLSRLGTTANLSPTLMATAGAIAIMEVLHRYLGKHREQPDRDGVGDEDSREDPTLHFPGLPGLPHQWSLEER